MSPVSEEDLQVHLPRAGAFGLDQDEEFFEIEENGERRRLRCHDYGEIYSVPGLYERIFGEVLSCRSPQVVIDLLDETLERHDADPNELRAFDLGAGNGMVAEELDRIGAEEIVGVDLLEEAKEAAERDRPGLYDAYHALNLTELDPDLRRELEGRGFNCLTCVAALGFGDLPPDAFQAAYELVAPGGWIAFNIRDQFLENGDSSGFSRLLEQMFESGELVEHARHRYRHRVSVSGEPLYYVAVVAQKAR
jgi:predicted TPR repeat methyltransferase